MAVDPKDPNLKKRNRAVGLALFGFVVFLAVVSYFRAKGLAP